MTFAQLLQRSVERAPRQTALVVGDQRWSYAELDTVSDRVTAGLATAGVQINDRVAFFLPNCPELIFSYLACFKLGAIAVPLNHRYRQAEAEYALTHSGSTTLILHTDKLPDVRGLNFDSLGVKRIFLVGGPVAESKLQPYSVLLNPTARSLEAPPFNERQLATIMYTSGTTARPKGVVHSQHSMTRFAALLAESIQLTAEDVTLISTSASHCASSIGELFPTLMVGGKAVMLNAPTPADVVQAIERERVTRCQMLPTGLLDLVEYIEQHGADLSSLRSFFAGGDAVPHDTHQRFQALTGWHVSEVCGMTEAVTYLLNPPYGDKRLGSVGKPLAETKVRIVDALGADLPIDQVGEIQVLGPANMVGYWNDTLSTAATFADGWLSSGDLGRLDADGYVWFVGRKKEIIIRGGSNISPAEIEEVIDQNPAVHMSGVVGQADPHWGQIVVAFVAPCPDAEVPTEAELREFVAGHISAYKVPARFVILPELPLNFTGKVDRKQLHERLAREPVTVD